MTLDVHGILAQHGHEATRLVQILRDVMKAEGWISPQTITALARALLLPRGRVEGVAAFYSFFSSQPAGRYRVLFSDNITDEMAGSRQLRGRMLDAFGLRLGEVSRDGLVSVGVTSCTGMCDQGPAMLVNGQAIARLTPARIGAVSALIRGGTPVRQWPENLLKVDSHVERKDLLLNMDWAPGAAITAAVKRGRAETLVEIDRSGLRGRGGAGFSTGRKWLACAEAPGPQRCVVCNADEGEPGTFKDRMLLSDRTHQVLEGMTVAAYAVGAQTGFLYVRGEYEFLEPTLQKALDERRAHGLLGPAVAGVAGFDFDIEIHWGAGAYVCGEETALIESLEGKRGIPRNRPPYPVTHGYLNQPTTVNNVETLVAAAGVVIHGADWFRGHGTTKSTGTRLHSVSGDVARPGVYEYPYGTPVQQLLDDAGAADIQAIQVGGPSGTLLGRTELQRRVAFEDVPSAGAFMVFNSTRNVVDVVDNFARFFAHESCGFCTPCRVGTTLVSQMTGRLAAETGTRRDVKDLLRVCKVMKHASHCGLGATAGNCVVDALEKFRPSFDKRLASLEVMPSFDLDKALAPAREATGREDSAVNLWEDKP